MVDDIFEMDKAPGIYYGAILSTLFGACILFMFFCAFWAASGFDYVPVITPFGDWVVEVLSRSQI